MLVNTAARSPVASAIPMMVTTVRARFFASVRSVKEARTPRRGAAAAWAPGALLSRFFCAMALPRPHVGGHAAVLDGHDAVRGKRDVLVVRDHDEGLPELRV